MKIRQGFVTNSSSSSFILAMKDKDFTPEQEKVILDFFREHILGTPLLLPGQAEEAWQKILDENYMEGEIAQASLEAVRAGSTVYQGRIDYEECEYRMCDALEKLLQALQDASPKNLMVIDGDLSY